MNGFVTANILFRAVESAFFRRGFMNGPKTTDLQALYNLFTIA